jgi:hypothetical protein
MAKINRMVALGLMVLADSSKEPRWNEKNPKASQYLEAWKKLKKG